MKWLENFSPLAKALKDIESIIEEIMNAKEICSRNYEAISDVESISLILFLML